MAEKSESINDLKFEIADSRERLARELRGLRYELPARGNCRQAHRRVGSNHRFGALERRQQLLSFCARTGRIDRRGAQDLARPRHRR